MGKLFKMAGCVRVCVAKIGRFLLHAIILLAHKQAHWLNGYCVLKASVGEKVK